MSAQRRRRAGRPEMHVCGFRETLRSDRNPKCRIVGSEVPADLSASAHGIPERCAGAPCIRARPFVPCAERDEPVRVLPILNQHEGLGTGQFLGRGHERRPPSHELLFPPILHRPDPAREWLADPEHGPSHLFERATNRLVLRSRVRIAASSVRAGQGKCARCCRERARQGTPPQGVVCRLTRSATLLCRRGYRDLADADSCGEGATWLSGRRPPCARYRGSRSSSRGCPGW